MKTVAFFHRLELTNLFGPVSKQLPSNMQSIHIAYSEDEARQLFNQGIKCDYIFKNEIKKILSNLTLDLNLINEIEQEINKNTDGNFTLNSAIQSDRAFSCLSYEECLILTSAYWIFWKNITKKYNLDYILHEPVSLMMNFASAIIITENGGHYLYCIMTRGFDSEYNFMVMSGVELYSPAISAALSDPDRSGRLSNYTTAEIDQFLKSFRVDISNYQGGVVAQSVSLPFLFIKSIYNKLKKKIQIIKKDKIVDCIEYWTLSQNIPYNKIRNLTDYRKFVRFDEPKANETYWFYPLHLEPEAVVLYQAHGIYNNQVKLIENIAAQLPAGHYLYVKDHPHDLGYRAAVDYARLNAVPNIRLLRASIPGKSIIRDAYGVITITGTAGFEAMLMAKPVIVFGRTFYSQGPGVIHVRNIRDLRDALTNLQANNAIDDQGLIEFLDAYFSSLHPGMTDFFVGRAELTGLNLAENATTVANGLVRAIQQL
jgi:hypothetical protein